jgi:4-amino-4-deoxy-L-arabinose transferase-like glycosyltransferase
LYRSGAPPKGAGTMQGDSCTSRRWVYGLLALTLVARLAALWLGRGGLAQDPDNYRGLAENMLAYGVLGHDHTPSAYRPPLYPLMLVPCAALGTWSAVAIGALHLALGLASVWGVHWLARRWQLEHVAGFAAALVACDPILVHYSAQVMTETLAAFLATAALAALTLAGERPTARRLAAAGAIMALAALCRPTFLVWLACVVPIVVRHAPNGKLRFRRAAAFLAGAAVVLAPWALRNWAQLGRPIVATTHGGYTLWLGNNASYYEFLEQGNTGDVWRATDFDAEVLEARSAAIRHGEIDDDRREYAQAWHEIRKQPRMFVHAALARVGRFWGLVPRRLDEHESEWRRWGRYTTGVWYLAEFVFAALGLASLSRREPAETRRRFVPGLLLAASFTAVHVLFWTDLRMRAAVEPIVALTAAAGMPRRGAASIERKALCQKHLQ